jgi:hypothetical protein
MKNNYSTLMCLGQLAIVNPKLISNHLENNIPSRLRDVIETNLIIINAVLKEDPLFAQDLAAECVDALPVLKNYMKALDQRLRNSK